MKKSNVEVYVGDVKMAHSTILALDALEAEILFRQREYPRYSGSYSTIVVREVLKGA